MEKDYLKERIEIAFRNAKAADVLGKYAEADWWETRGRELLSELTKDDNKTTEVRSC